MDELTELVAIEGGKAWGEAMGDVLKAKEGTEQAIAAPSLMMGESTMDASKGYDTVLYREPLGVFAGIVPYNFPAMIPMGWMAPMCIATGNTMVIKAEISEADVVKVKPGQKVYFTILGDPDNRIEATLREIEPAHDEHWFQRYGEVALTGTPLGGMGVLGGLRMASGWGPSRSASRRMLICSSCVMPVEGMAETAPGAMMEGTGFMLGSTAWAWACQAGTSTVAPAASSHPQPGGNGARARPLACGEICLVMSVDFLAARSITGRGRNAGKKGRRPQPGGWTMSMAGKTTGALLRGREWIMI